MFILIIILAVALIVVSALLFKMSKLVKHQAALLAQRHEEHMADVKWWNDVYNDKHGELLDTEEELEKFQDALEKDRDTLENAKRIVLEQEQTITNLINSVNALNEEVVKYESIPELEETMRNLELRLNELGAREARMNQTLAHLTEQILDVKAIEEFANGTGDSSS